MGHRGRWWFPDDRGGIDHCCTRGCECEGRDHEQQLSWHGTSVAGVLLAEAHGVPARLIMKHEEVHEAIEWARNTKGPVVLEFRVEQEEAVYPMVPQGAALDQMIQRPVRQAG